MALKAAGGSGVANPLIFLGGSRRKSAEVGGSGGRKSLKFLGGSRLKSAEMCPPYPQARFRLTAARQFQGGGIEQAEVST